ncbi:hypothetical protein ACOME3_000820 [Neoechinorhynchus agilis]
MDTKNLMNQMDQSVKHAQNPITSGICMYVGNLEKEISEIHLFNLFCPFGDIQSVIIKRQKDGSSRGFGFVQFKRLAEAQKAKEILSYCCFPTKPIRIMFAKTFTGKDVQSTRKTNVFIRNLKKTIMDRELYETFDQFGPVGSCRISRDSFGRSLGYGYIDFENPQDAERAIERVDRKMIEDQIVRLDYFRPRAERVGLGKSVSVPKANNLYVKHFRRDVDEKQLEKIFEPFGRITSLKIMRDEGGLSRGFGFVSYDNDESARIAKNELETKEGLYISYAQRKSERQYLLSQKHMEGSKKSLYVKHFGPDLNEEKLKKMFDLYGEIFSVKITRDENGSSKCFGFVNFKHLGDAEKAKKEMHLSPIDGKFLYVSYVQSKSERLEALKKYKQEISLGYSSLSDYILAAQNSASGVVMPC